MGKGNREQNIGIHNGVKINVTHKLIIFVELLFETLVDIMNLSKY